MEGRLSQPDASVLRCLGRFCSGQGLEVALGPQVVEAFCCLGLAGRAPWTRGTYRSALRRASPPGRLLTVTAFPGSPAKAPYSPEERAELASTATSQRSAWRRASALSFLALGIGAGLRPAELRAVVGDDVVAQRGRTSVRARATGRVVPVAGAYAKDLARLAKQAGPGHLFCPGHAERSYKNFVNSFCYDLVADPAAPRYCSGRARSSFVCDHLVAGTPLRQLLYMSGIVEVGSLLRYARHVDGAPGSKAELRARLGEG